MPRGPYSRVKQRAATSWAVSTAAAVLGAAAVAGILTVTLRTTSFGTAPSETKALSEAAQTRAQVQEGKRLLDRLQTAGQTEAGRPASKPKALPAPLPAPPTTVAAVPLPPPPTATEPPAAPANSDTPGVLASLRARLLGLPPIGTNPTLARTTDQSRDRVALQQGSTAPDLLPPLVRARFAPVTLAAASLRAPSPPFAAAPPPHVAVPPPVAPPVVAFVLRPFDHVALARFRASEHDLSPSTPVAASVPEAIAATAGGSGAPSFGSVDPVPMAAEIAHQTGKHGPVNCVAILEQAQLGDLSAEDRQILKTKCR